MAKTKSPAGKKTASKVKTTPASKTPKTKLASKPGPKAKAKKKATDWGAVLRTGKAGVRKWNNLSSGERLRASIVGADLSNADLTGVKFSFVDLSGVNLRGAKLDDAFFGSARFDEKTKWPKEIKLADSLVWKGKGPDPR